MPASALYMSMSADGYIAGPDDRPGNPGGDGFDRLHEWFEGPDGQLWDEMFSTGAVLAGGGLRMFEALPSRIELEVVRVIDTPKATHLHYRVRR